MPALTLPRLLAVGLGLCLIAGVSRAADGPSSISPGEMIELREHLVPGKTVVVGFYSAYSPGCPCALCAALDNPLQAMDEARDDVVVILVDVNRPGVTGIDWHSPVVMQFGLRTLPHFMIFGPDGRMVAEDDPQHRRATAREQVHAMIETLPAHGATVAVATNGS